MKRTTPRFRYEDLMGYTPVHSQQDRGGNNKRFDLPPSFQNTAQRSEQTIHHSLTPADCDMMFILEYPDNSAMAKAIRRNPNYCPCGLDRFLNSRLGQTWMSRRGA